MKIKPLYVGLLVAFILILIFVLLQNNQPGGVILPNGNTTDNGTDSTLYYRLTLDKGTYRLGENVEMTFETNDDELCVLYDWEPYGWDVQKLEDGKWVLVGIKPTIALPFCENNELVSIGAEAPFYGPVENKHNTWEQTKTGMVEKTCGDEKYTAYEESQVSIGKYKATFCYSKMVEDENGKKICVPPNGSERCVEKEFEIVS